MLLADEPTGNLDEDTRDDIIARLGNLSRERSLALVLVTHDTSVARRAQRIGVMNSGRLTTQRASGAATASRGGPSARPPSSG